MTITKTASFQRQSAGQCPLRNISVLMNRRYIRNSRRDILLAIVLDIFSNFSLKG